MSLLELDSNPHINTPHLHLVPGFVEQPIDYEERARLAVLRIQAEGDLAKAAFEAREIMGTSKASPAQLVLARSIEYPTNIQGLEL